MSVAVYNSFYRVVGINFLGSFSQIMGLVVSFDQTIYGAKFSWEKPSHNFMQKKSLPMFALNSSWSVDKLSTLT